MNLRRVLSSIIGEIETAPTYDCRLNANAPRIEVSYEQEGKKRRLTIFLGLFPCPERFSSLGYSLRGGRMEIYLYDKEENVEKGYILPLAIIEGEKIEEDAEEIFKNIAKRVGAPGGWNITLKEFIEHIEKNIGTKPIQETEGKRTYIYEGIALTVKAIEEDGILSETVSDVEIVPGLYGIFAHVLVWLSGGHVIRAMTLRTLDEEGNPMEKYRTVLESLLKKIPLRGRKVEDKGNRTVS